MNGWRWFWILGIGFLGVWWGACAPASPAVSPLEGFSPLPAPVLPTPTPPPVPASPGGPSMESPPGETIEQARRDLAGRLGVPAEEIRVVEARAVLWPDTSLGCPEPDRAYAQVLTPGFRVVLEAQGRRYAYHGGLEGPLVLCPSERAREPAMERPGPSIPMPTPASGESGEGSMEEIIEQARRDLAGRLSVSVEEIRGVEARAVTWPDSSLGCPEPGRLYLQVLTPGYRVVLEARGQRYAYHAGRQGPPFLCPPDRAKEPY
ncbi:hypothetical protein [Thermoflexus sp.]|uniref:hypothetical protein n=1 Tax=Thermoflexus sp. TaxID=1969742 RepID=UPI00260CA3CD|nr:hypothetical protein [Thermoflexus sp.]MCX7690206.1 hypothetical protein [Thermoflexus sp.]MDW8185975.1 hypothetical protein [Anaerolineae bacterium]